MLPCRSAHAILVQRDVRLVGTAVGAVLGAPEAADATRWADRLFLRHLVVVGRPRRSITVPLSRAVANDCRPYGAPLTRRRP